MITLLQPSKIVFGTGCTKQFCDDFIALGHKRLFVLTVPVIRPMISEMIDTLTEKGVSIEVYENIMQEPSVNDFKQTLNAARQFGADSVVGVGGGSVLDVAKLVAALVESEQQVEDLFGIGFVKQRGKWFACMPTTAGTGSEVTAVSVLTNDETGVKKSISGDDCYAKIAFCDPKYTESMSYKTTVSTALDAFAHAVEGFFTERCEGIHKVFAQNCIPSLYRCLKSISQTGEVNPELREPLYYASIYAGLVINNCGTAFPHPLGYVLTENYGVPHGMACAAFFAPYIDRCAEFAPEKFAQFTAMTEDINKVKAVIASLTDLGGASIGKENAEKYALRWQSVIPGNFTASPGGLTQKEAAEILALII